MRPQRYSHTPAALLLLVALACTGDPAKTVGPGELSIRRNETAGSLGNAGVLPPQSDAFGKNYGEWSAQWWQWVFKQPVPDNPFLDATGAKCANGQSGHLWFLHPAAGGTECVVPTGRGLFFLLAGGECSNVEGLGATAAELRACAKAITDQVSDLAVEIDGISIQNPASYLVLSPAFNFVLPGNNVFQAFGIPAPAGSCYPSGGTCVDYLSVSGAYALLLAPLSGGVHTIHLNRRFGGSPSDVTYKLTVAPME